MDKTRELILNYLVDWHNGKILFSEAIDGICELTAERDRYKGERDALMEMIRIIPCTCHAGYKDRNLIDPDCPRCNHVDEDLINKIKEG